MRWSRGQGVSLVADRIAEEEPLVVRVAGRNVAVTMRTAGHDRELAAGFLLTEGVVQTRDQLLDLLHCRDLDGGSSGNVIEALLAPGVVVDHEHLTRHVFTASSCGICGKTTLDAVFQAITPITAQTKFQPDVLATLPLRLAQAQPGFGVTGGLHASALFSATGDIEIVREDIGRHNALDKVLGRALLDDRLPLSEFGILVSGRISFELVQKSLAAGIPLIAGIGAPSSLAVECARRGGQTVIGFLRADRMNVYTNPDRVM